MLLDYLKLIRPLNCAMGALGTLAAVFISGGGPIDGYVLGAVTASLAMAAGNVLNDYTDVEIDGIAHPDRPLPSGRIGRQRALYLSTALFLLAVLASLPLGVSVFIIVLINVSLMVAYETVAKKNPAGNMIISYLVGSIFLFGGAIAGRARGALPLFLLAFFATFGREIAKGIEDAEGDRGKRRTIALINPRMARSLSAAFVTLAIALSPLPYLCGILSGVYMALVMIADALFIYSAVKLLKGERASSTMRYSMLVALISFIGGAI